MSVSIQNKKQLGLTIRKQRIKEEKTLRKLAAVCEISPASLSDIENGVLFPGVKTFLNIVETLNFNDKSSICDLYARLKETAPPDIIDFLAKNEAAVSEVRLLMNKGKEVGE